MAPNADYSTIERPVLVEREAHKPQVSYKLVAAVAVCSVALFFAGRVNSHPSEFAHQEVLDVQAFCGDGQFIGKCNKCKVCADFEFNNGGCSYFKDTFCSYCEPIKNCVRERVHCTTRYNSQCQLCDCHDPIQDYSDIEVGAYHDATEYFQEGTANIIREANVGHKTYACYIADNPDSKDEAGTCKPCKVCPKGTYESKACDPETNEDTVCTPCTRCEEKDGSHWTKIECSYFENTVCEECVFCDYPTYAKEACVQGSIYQVGQQAVCSECAFCDDGEYVTAFCEFGEHVPHVEGSDTQCAPCSKCKGTTERTADFTQWQEHIAGFEGICKKGERFKGDGCADDEKEGGLCVQHDTVCIDCEMPQEVSGCDDDGTGCSYWFATACLADEPDKPVVEPCDECSEGSWEVRPCGEFQSTVCRACADNIRPDPFSGKIITGKIEHCNFEDHRCHPQGKFFEPIVGVHHGLVDAANAHEGDEGLIDYGEALNAEHQILSYCATKDPEGERCNGRKEECNMDACQNGFMGPQCQYTKIYSACAGDANSDNKGDYLAERTAKKGRKWFDDSALDMDIHFPGDNKRSDNLWLAWCMRECEENPFCHAFEIEDGGDSAEESGKWEVVAKTTCRLFKNTQVCPEFEDNFEPDYSKDCYVNVKRDPEVLARANACPKPMHPKDPPGVLSPVVRKPDKCDTYKGESWCPQLEACIDRTSTPCPSKKGFQLDHVCPEEDEAYCYCKTACLKKTETCMDPWINAGSFTLVGVLHDSCWAVEPLVKQVFGNGDTEDDGAFLDRV